MKAVFKTFFSIVILLSVSTLLFAQTDEKQKEKKRYEHFKERDISKTYPASGNTLNIDNSFGAVKINVWTKNEIKVDIHIESSSTDKNYAETTFERIEVTDKQEGKDIRFKTTMKDNKEKISCKNCKSTMSIDYTVYIPSSNALNIKNSFGSIDIPDYAGPVSLTSMYGSLTAGKLDKLGKLDVKFGSANLKYLSNSNVTFGYSSITIGNLSGSNKIKMEFCGYSKINLDNSLSSLSLDESYSQVHLQPPANFSASYDISTSYGSFTDKTNADIKRTDTPDRYGGDFKKHYEGKSGSGNAKIVIKSSFGNIMIGEGDKEDMKPKKRVKS